MRALERAVKKPASIGARRALLEEWRALGYSQAELIEQQLLARELRIAGQWEVELGVQETINDLLRKHRREWAGRVHDLVRDYEFSRGLINSVRLTSTQFVSSCDELFALAPIQHITLENPLDELEAFVSSPYLSQLISVRFRGREVGNRVARCISESRGFRSVKVIGLGATGLNVDGAEALAASAYLRNVLCIWSNNNPANFTPYFQEDEVGLFHAVRPALAVELEQKFGRRPWLEFPEGATHENYPPDAEELAMTP